MIKLLNSVFNNQKILCMILSIFLITLGSLFFWYGLGQKQPNTEINLSSQRVDQTNTKIESEVKRVIDGDTIEILSGEKVRYIGIDTPETVDPRRPVACFGKEASDENKRLVEGKRIILEKDVSETDKFGRLLRLVYLKDENGNLLFINDYLARQGYAKASTYPPDVKFSSQFVEAEKEARENQRGLWQKCL